MKEAILRRIVAAVRALFGRLSSRTVARIGIALGDIAYVLDRRHRSIAIRNLQMAFGDSKSDDEIRRITREVFRNFCMTGAEFLQIPSLTYERGVEFITPENRDRLDGCLKQGKGVVLVGSHFGNWELMAAAGALAGYPISAVAKPMKHSFWNDVINEIREASGVKIIARDGSAFSIVKRLKRNEIVGILADQNMRRQNVFVDFFGMKASTTTGPALLALKTGAALVPAFMLRNGSGKYRLIIEEPVQVTPTGDLEADTVSLTQKHAAVLEEYVRKYPSQWLWLHRRWRTRPKGEPPRYGEK